MLKQALNVLVIALALCIAAAFGGEVWRASHAPQSPSQRATAKNDYKADHTTSEERQQIIEQAIANYNLGLMVFTGLLFVATAGLGIMNFYQLRLARAEFISTHRPKIVVRNVHIPREYKKGWPIGSHVGVAYDLVNVGDTPATIVGTIMEIRLLNNAGLLTNIRPARKGDSAMPGLVNFRMEVGANLTQWFGNPEALYDGNHFLTYPAADGLFFQGHILYEDDNGILRRTSFCRRFDGQRGFWRKAEYYDYEQED